MELKKTEKTQLEKTIGDPVSLSCRSRLENGEMPEKSLSLNFLVSLH